MTNSDLSRLINSDEVQSKINAPVVGMFDTYNDTGSERNMDVDHIREKLEKMLASPPQNVRKARLDMWKKMRTITCGELEDWWIQAAGNGQPLIDLEKTHYEEWTDQGEHWQGMRHN